MPKVTYSRCPGDQHYLINENSDMEKTHRIGNFVVRSELFEQVREHMTTALTISVTDDIVTTFLGQHGELLGSIVGYDEVDTSDRENLWNACKSAFPVAQQRHQH